jgi:type VI protein secretion system component VasF
MLSLQTIETTIMQIVFFKRTQPRRFDYKPRYYDEEKERREELRRKSEDASPGGSSDLRLEISRRWRTADRKNRRTAKGINLLVYLVIAALLVYFVFFV